MKCPVCGRPARVLHVDERDPAVVRITWLCPNPACSRYKQACGEELRPISQVHPADKPD